MSDVYAYWRAACRGASNGVEPLPTIGATIPGENPQCGLWKVRLTKGSPPVLMQVWLADEAGKPASDWRDGLTVAGILVVNPERALPQTADELAHRWLYAKPATKEEAAHFRQEGRWPADPPPLPPRTHNQPEDPFEALQAEAEDRLEQVRGWLHAHSPIGDQLACDTARNMQAALLELGKRGDTMHRIEKDPVIKRGREIDTKYGFRATLGDWAAKLRAAFEAFMRAEERRLQIERDRVYREQTAAQQAEQARLDAERAKKLADYPVSALTDPPPEPVPPPPPPAPVKVQAGGGTGRKSGLKDDWDIEITDYGLAALLVIEDPEIAILVGKVIKRHVRAARGRGDWPGVKVTAVRRAA